MQQARIPKDVRNAVQNHFDGDMDELYGHYSFEKEKREALSSSMSPSKWFWTAFRTSFGMRACCIQLLKVQRRSCRRHGTNSACRRAVAWPAPAMAA